MKKRLLNPPLQIIEIGDGAVAAIAILDAKRGNRYLLLSLLRAEDCPREVRAFAADMIEGKIKLPKHRPAANPMIHTLIAMRVIELEELGAPRKNAVGDTAIEFGCSQKTVRNALRVMGCTGK